MGKLKVAAQNPDPEVTVELTLERADALYVAGDEIVGSVVCQASHAFDFDGFVLVLKGKQRVRGYQRRPFQWIKLHIHEETLAEGGGSYAAGQTTIPFRFPLDLKLPPTSTIEFPSVGSCSQVKVTQSYSLTAVLSLRNSTKTISKAHIGIGRNTDVVWPHAVPSASIDDSTSLVVASPFSSCCCWRRGETSISATLHNRIVDIETGVVHVRVLVVNRSALVVNAARLSLVVDVALHPEKRQRGGHEEDEDEEDTAANETDNAHRFAELLYATDYRTTRIQPGASAHLTLEMGIRQVSSALLTSQETLLEPTLRTQYLEIDYVVRIEVCHANGGSTVTLDLPLVLVPLATDVLPPVETHPLAPICGRESQQSTEHEDDQELKATDIHVSVSTTTTPAVVVTPDPKD